MPTASDRGRRRRGARGFTLPLTTALAFSLMAMAAGVVGAVSVQAQRARAAERDLAVRVSLESAAQRALYPLVRDGLPDAPRWTARDSVNGLAVRLTLYASAYKPDVNLDSGRDAAAATADAALGAQLVDRLGPTAPPVGQFRFPRFKAFASAMGAGPEAEDCLRTLLTIGRKDAVRKEVPKGVSLAAAPAPLQIGDLVEVRAETPLTPPARAVLWTRVRYTGRPEQPWLTHDWRLLRLGAPVACRPAAAA